MEQNIIYTREAKNLYFILTSQSLIGHQQKPDGSDYDSYCPITKAFTPKLVSNKQSFVSLFFCRYFVKQIHALPHSL